MNIFICTMLWIVLIPVVLALIILFTSGFDGLGVILVPVILIMILPIFLFGATSFLVGYYGLQSWISSISILVVSGLLTLFLTPLCIQLSADPALLFGTLKLLLLFVLFFAAGYIGRFLPKEIVVLEAVIVALPLLYISLGQAALGAYMPFDYRFYWNGDSSSKIYSQLENGTRYYTYPKMFIDPFPAKVIGIKYCNDRGEFVGYSNADNISYHVAGEPYEPTTSDNSDILLHKNYAKNLSAMLASASNAIRKDGSQHSVLLYYDNNTLFRNEIFYHPNGVVERIDRYSFNKKLGAFDMCGKKSFDPLGYTYPQKWSVHDFRKSNGVPRIVQSLGISADSLGGRELDKSQSLIAENIHIIDTLRNRLKEKGMRSDNIEVLLASAQFSRQSKVCLSVNPNGQMWNLTFSSNFTQLKSVEQMETILDALALCRLESAVGEIHQDYPQCAEIRIDEIGSENYIALFLLNDRAISVDFRFSFIYDPMMHTDPKKRADAKRLWEEVKHIVKFSSEVSESRGKQ